jgi:hypothetical protein
VVVQVCGGDAADGVAERVRLSVEYGMLILKNLCRNIQITWSAAAVRR